MVVAALAVLLIVFGMHHGGTNPIEEVISQLEKSTKHAVTAQDKRESADKVLKEMTETLKQYQKVRSEAVKSLEKVGENYDAKPADFQAVFDANSKDTEAVHAKMIELQTQLKTSYTEAEWKAALAPPPEKEKIL